MGVPSFYKWLVGKYPKIRVNAVEKDDGGNPNGGREFDNLYLDMNGIIHPCFHPQGDDDGGVDQLHPESYQEVFENIFAYIDRILIIVRPRKLLYMAIDGVAPRAKMNQQRTRRFRTAKDREILGKEEDRLRRQYELEGKNLLPQEESEVSDSNVITPGTDFMYELSKQLQTYTRLRISNHPAWKRLKVILSDANVPGEGEHKIMSFIRLQRTCPGYNPNTSHVLYGLDADLIMLALATHEVHFSILRENVLSEDNLRSNSSLLLAGKSEANVAKCRGWFKQFDLSQGLKDTDERMSNLEISGVSKRNSLVKKPYQFLHVWILREYLNLDLRMTNLPEKFELDIERLIDDFIFICFFAGNDFLPHMPTLEIHERAIDLLIHVYKEEFKNLGGYLVDVQRVNDKKGGYIKMKRVEKFILAVGAFEDKIFRKRSNIREKKLRRMLSDIADARGDGEEDLFHVIQNTYNPEGLTVSTDGDSPCSARSPNHNMLIVENTKMLKEQLKSYTREISDVFRNGLVTDPVKLGNEGWKKRYYKYKFSAESDQDIENMRKNLIQKYIEGLCWVLLYYFSGVPSWTWFFPYHYAPFASDLKGLSSTKTMFRKGLPFKPFDQLMAVLPPMSAHALPASYRSLMTDEDSSILDFYPSDFDIDTDGKRYLWQGICKLPFIEEERLLAATKKIEKELGEEEAKRNGENVEQFFVHGSDNLALHFISAFNAAGSVKQNISMGLSGEINGFVHFKQEPEDDRDVLCVYYQPPSSNVHIPRVLEGTTIRETVVSESDIVERELWHDIQGCHSRVARSYNHHVRGAKSNHSTGFRSSCPGAVIKGGGSGWSPRGRGYNACWDAYGRGAWGNENYRSRWTSNSPMDSGLQQRRMVQTQSTNSRYPARTNTTNENYRSRWTSDSPMDGGLQQRRMVQTQSTNSRYPGRTNTTNENYRSRWTSDSPMDGGLQQRRMVQTQSTNSRYPARTNNTNENYRSVRTGSGSSSNHALNRWSALGEANNCD